LGEERSSNRLARRRLSGYRENAKTLEICLVRNIWHYKKCLKGISGFLHEIGLTLIIHFTRDARLGIELSEPHGEKVIGITVALPQFGSSIERTPRERW
jgi:hypothetical protein